MSLSAENPKPPHFSDLSSVQPYLWVPLCQQLFLCFISSPNKLWVPQRLMLTLILWLCSFGSLCLKRGILFCLAKGPPGLLLATTLLWNPPWFPKGWVRFLLRYCSWILYPYCYSTYHTMLKLAGYFSVSSTSVELQEAGTLSLRLWLPLVFKAQHNV